MYGYSFGAAKANVWHRYHTTAMIYPGYQPIGTLEPAPKHLILWRSRWNWEGEFTLFNLRLLCRGSKGAALWPAVEHRGWRAQVRL